MTEWIELGYWGLFLAAFLAATVLPFSSDVLLGLMLSGDWDPLLLFIAATTGNFLGGLLTYWMGYLGKWEWIEKWFGVKRSKVEKQMGRLQRWGKWAALLTWVPFIGDVLAIALGFVRAPFWTTALLMLIGKGGRFALIIWIVTSAI
jgi:membrane protein YqaA with SNARE-associated domain